MQDDVTHKGDIFDELKEVYPSPISHHSRPPVTVTAV